MSTLRTTTLKHGGSTILDNLVLSNAGETRFCPNSSFGRAALYVDGQTNRVGVNTETPGVALDVDGALNATGNVAIGGTLDVTGNVSFNGTADFAGNVNVDTLEATTSVTVGVPGTAGVVVNNGGYLFIRQPSANGVAVDIYDASVSTAFIRGNGQAKFEQIGVNTTTPDSKLQIAADAVDTDIFTIRRQDSTTVNLFRFFQDSRITGGAGCAHINTVNRSLLITATAGAETDSGLLLTTTSKLLLGTDSSITVSNNESRVQILGDDQSTGRMSIIRTSVDDGGAGIHLCKSRGVSGSSFNLPNADDQVGILVANAASNSSNINKQVASIQFRVDSTPTTSNIPGRLSLFTTTKTGSNPSEKLRIDSEGATTQYCYFPSASLTTVLYSGSVTDNAQSGTSTFDVTFTLPDSANYFICEVIGYHPNYTAANEYYRFVASKRVTNNTHVVSIIDDLTSTGSTSVTDTTVTFTGRRPRSTTGTSINSVIQVIYRGIQTPIDVTIANS